MVAETGLSFKKAEKALNEMLDFSRVNMRVSGSGIVVCEFVEIRNGDLGNVRRLSEKWESDDSCGLDGEAPNVGQNRSYSRWRHRWNRRCK